MKFASALLSRLGIAGHTSQDVFELRLQSMTSPAATGPRLRRTVTPALFAFRRAV